MLFTALRQRALPPPAASRTSFINTPLQSRIYPSSSTTALRPVIGGGSGTPQIPASTNIPVASLPLPRAILPRERSVLDKMVDYLVGDGPSNRYALICQQCFSHNGWSIFTYQISVINIVYVQGWQFVRNLSIYLFGVVTVTI